MSGYRINEEDIQKALRQLQRDDPENANREYVIQLLESMHGFAKSAASTDSKTLKELDKALEEKEAGEEEAPPSDDEEQTTPDNQTQESD